MRLATWIYLSVLGSVSLGCSTSKQPSPDGIAGASAGAVSGGGGGQSGATPVAALGGAGAAGGLAAAHAGAVGGSAGASGSKAPVLDAGAGAPQPDAALVQDAAIDAGTKGKTDCDRACLIAVFDAYLTALSARDSSTLKLSAMLKYTENGTAQKVGQGLWMTASKLEADTRVSYADPMTGQVGGQLVLDENGTSPVLYQARLKVVDHEITEIESMAVRQLDAANGFFSVAGMKPETLWAQAIDPSKRLTRDQLKAEVEHYIDYLDGKTNSSGVHLDANCARYENGVQTASGAGFALQNWSFDVVPRFLIFDEEYGIAWGMFPFTHDPSTLVVGEAFKVVDSKIMMIRAVMANMPAMAWD